MNHRVNRRVASWCELPIRNHLAFLPAIRYQSHHQIFRRWNKNTKLKIKLCAWLSVTVIKSLTSILFVSILSFGRLSYRAYIKRLCLVSYAQSNDIQCSSSLYRRSCMVDVYGDTRITHNCMVIYLPKMTNLCVYANNRLSWLVWLNTRQPIDHFQQLTDDTDTLIYSRGRVESADRRSMVYFIRRFASALTAVHNAILGNYAPRTHVCSRHAKLAGARLCATRYKIQMQQVSIQ